MNQKIGFIHIAVNTLNTNTYSLLNNLSHKCEQLIVGIPDRWTYARIFGSDTGYDDSAVKDMLSCIPFISSVVVLKYSDLLMVNAHKKFGFDLYFYGNEYGSRFLSDLKYADEHNIVMESVAPSSACMLYDIDALRLALSGVSDSRKIVLFGTGAYFDMYMEKYGKQYKPAYAIDNDCGKWNTTKQGVPVKEPEELIKENPGKTLVILCGKKYEELKKQLLSYDNFDYRTMLFCNEVAMPDEMGIALDAEQQYLEKAHSVLEKMLFTFDEVCRKHNIRYYMICGSLIGTIRHKGFIPWDDDVDVAIPREDYERLKKVWKSEIQSDEYMFLDYKELGREVFLDCMTRLLYTGEYFPTKVFSKVKGSKCKEGPNRLFIDIYVMDSAYDSPKKHSFHMNELKVIYNLAMGHRKNINYDDYSRIGKKTIRVMKIVHAIGRLFPLKLLLNLYDSVSKKANKNRGMSGAGTENYYMNSCAITCIERKFKKDWFGDGKRVPFENIEVMIPNDADALLEGMKYHDYMKLPPFNMQRPSHYFNSEIEIW